MIENPYASPTDVVPEDEETAVDPRVEQGPFVMAMIGGIVGPFSGALFGALGAAALAISAVLARYLLKGNSPDLTGAVLGGGLIGGFCGIPTGAIVGVLCGIVAGLTRESYRRKLCFIAAGISAIEGALVGAYGGLLVGADSFDAIASPNILAILFGIIVGGASGFFGGWYLGRALGIINWGRPPESQIPRILKPLPPAGELQQEETQAV